jgi:hypothetical protein
MPWGLKYPDLLLRAEINPGARAGPPGIAGGRDARDVSWDCGPLYFSPVVFELNVWYDIPMQYWQHYHPYYLSGLKIVSAFTDEITRAEVTHIKRVNFCYSNQERVSVSMAREMLRTLSYIERKLHGGFRRYAKYRTFGAYVRQVARVLDAKGIIFTKEGVTVNSSNRNHPQLTEVKAIDAAVPLIDALCQRLTMPRNQPDVSSV